MSHSVSESSPPPPLPSWVHDFKALPNRLFCLDCGHPLTAHAREHPQGPMFCLDCRKAATP